MCAEQKIKEYLNSNGVSQTFISNKTGISTQKLNLSLNRKRKLRLDEYELICGALSVGVDRFLEPKIPNRGKS